MPNWCGNELQVQASEADRQQIMDLIIKGDEVDFSIVAPHPEAIKGILGVTDKSVVLNRSYEPRLGQLKLDRFIQALNNQPEHGKDNSILEMLINSSPVRDLPGVKEEYAELKKQSTQVLGTIELTDEQKEHIKSIESALLEEIDSNEAFTLDTPVEDVIESLLTKKVNEKVSLPYAEEIEMHMHYVRHLYFSEALQYMISVLEKDVEMFCKKTYGSKNSYDWQVANWGTKWNAGEYWEVEGRICFDTAWQPPVAWFEALGEKIKSLGIDDYYLSLQYAEGGNWFGGYLINESGEIMHSEMDEDELIEVLGDCLSDEDDEDVFM